MKRIFLSFTIITAIITITLGATRAFFSDTETSVNNNLAAGAIDLLIGNESYYNGVVSDATSWLPSDLDSTTLFFDFNDLKPSDWGEDTIGIQVNTNDAWACMDITLTHDDDGTCTEPENLDDPSCVENNNDLFDGELGGLVNFIFWADDGDNVLEDNENNYILQGPASDVLNSSIALADSSSSVFPESLLADSGALIGEETYYIGKAWCFGTLTPEPLPQDNGSDEDRSPATTTGGISCDGSSINNAAQTDIVMGDVQFRAIQARNNESFQCTQDIVCEEVWADGFAEVQQKLRKNSTAVLATRSDPNQALIAETNGDPFDSSVTEGTFYSLGFGGSIVITFDNPIHNKDGNDLKIFEVTGGTSYPEEKIQVEAWDGVSWVEITSSLTRDGELDLGPLSQTNRIRITDISNINLFENTADGYDLDGVRAFCGTSQ